MNPHRLPASVWAETRPAWATAATWASVAADTVVDPAVRASVDAWAKQPSGVLLLSGPPGTGKTHMACALGQRAVDAGHRVVFARHAVTLNTRQYGPDAETWDLWLRTRFLVLDDLAASGALSDMGLAATDHLINTRLDLGLATIATSNMADQDLGAALGPRLASRVGQWTIVHVVNADRRKKPANTPA